MSNTSAATMLPASVQLPSGDTSGEGDTAGTDGQGDQAASSPAPVDSRNTPSPGRNSAGDDDAGDGHSTAGSPRSDALRGSRSDSAVNSRQTCVIGSTNSVGTQTADTMVTRFLTGLEVRRLETDNSLPAPELGHRGDVVAPTRCDFSMGLSSLGRTRLIGVPVAFSPGAACPPGRCRTCTLAVGSLCDGRRTHRSPPGEHPRHADSSRHP
ncbi:hypothetical protein PF007_g31295 [Phytophthora fragariae]|uniref:Uncharacterized protein n=1 Tax=Phytophthora fragariae TaxID=53985 RepID=A0A6A3PJF5_9STRA|nr:hypothetical protein PF003_g34931 [Phytophthora fragariae]KAE9058464.1 hypothetical protein PF007_g31295 [Phytophthora fragariae]KAE9261960.1 hypothetical protein PF001_g32223 [Phytophthora fragariae]